MTSEFYVLGSVCEASCLPGYEADSIGTFTCLEDRGWASVAPFQCEPKTCGNFDEHIRELMNPDGSAGLFMDCTGEKYLDTCVASCPDSWAYKFFCSESGSWVGNMGWDLECNRTVTGSNVTGGAGSLTY